MNNFFLNYQIAPKKSLKKAISANSALANLDGVARIIPNSAILINCLVLQEAKEVQNYKEALIRVFSLVKNTKLLLKKHIFCNKRSSLSFSFN